MVIMQQQTEITVASVITEHPTDGSSYPEVNLPDQPNRRIRIRTYGGVGGTLSDGRSYPDMAIP
jgi:hypothetical protein